MKTWGVKYVNNYEECLFLNNSTLLSYNKTTSNAPTSLILYWCLSSSHIQTKDAKMNLKLGIKGLKIEKHLIVLGFPCGITLNATLIVHF